MNNIKNINKTITFNPIEVLYLEEMLDRYKKQHEYCEMNWTESEKEKEDLINKVYTNEKITEKIKKD